ncbi:C-C motif chemokine 20 isoform X2 [Phascolarctos cinereus]|uniref:C-C motif chemokine n=1 Tax=Phascolarctos cinereus TaxID=38626 RepID=A0A6P5IWX2_PHACI|nr:C-C motif chemokine 20 isoform X2 [Phascolarctos cinereus]
MTRVGSKILILAPLMAVLLFCLFDTSQASSFDCCLGYTEHPLHSKLIKGYAEQWSYETCDIDAIIFYTRRYTVCADPNEAWVKHTLKILSSRLKKMSK